MLEINFTRGKDKTIGISFHSNEMHSNITLSSYDIENIFPIIKYNLIKNKVPNIRDYMNREHADIDWDYIIECDEQLENGQYLYIDEFNETIKYENKTLYINAPIPLDDENYSPCYIKICKRKPILKFVETCLKHNRYNKY